MRYALSIGVQQTNFKQYSEGWHQICAHTIARCAIHEQSENFSDHLNFFQIILKSLQNTFTTQIVLCSISTLQICTFNHSEFNTRELTNVSDHLKKFRLFSTITKPLLQHKLYGILFANAFATVLKQCSVGMHQFCSQMKALNSVQTKLLWVQCIRNLYIFLDHFIAL